MDAETPDKQYGFTIDGEIYSEPENLTVLDHRIIKRYTGLNFRDLAARSNDEMYVDQDGIAAILHISYRHVHPELSFDEIAEIVGNQDLDVAHSTLRQDDGDDARPPELTTPPDESSPRSTSEKNGDSGTDLSPSSDPSDESPATTGIPESGTSLPELVPGTAEA